MRAAALLPPGPRSPVPGLIGVRFARDRLRFLELATRTYGDVVFFHAAGVPAAILNHPDYVRDVLVNRQRMFRKGVALQRSRLLLGDGLLTSEGDYHRRRRHLMQPAFHRERIEAYAAAMVECAQRRVEQWTSGSSVDLAAEFAAITLHVAGRTLFDTDVSGETSEIREALATSLASFNFALLPFGEQLARLPVPPAIRFRRARARLDALICRLIKERRRDGIDRGDLLSSLVFLRDAEGAPALTDTEIRDEAVTILLAGHETSANALTWTCWLLSRHRDSLVRLREELDRVLLGRAPTAADLPRLPYTRGVIAEGMRLCPPAYVLGRAALEPYDVPGTPYVIPAGTTVLLSQHLLHRDPRFWDRPEAFEPQRWLEERPERLKYAYFPFGAGTRICIGEQFAWMEIALVLATVAQQWTFELAPNARVEADPLLTLRTRYGMKMTLRRADRAAIDADALGPQLAL